MTYRTRIQVIFDVLFMPHRGAHRRLESDKGTTKTDVSFGENDDSIN